MAITRGAKKTHRSSLRKSVFNAHRRIQISKTIKSLKKLIEAGDKKKAEIMMREVEKALDKAVKTKVIKKNNASRKKSRLSKLIKKL